LVPGPHARAQAHHRALVGRSMRKSSFKSNFWSCRPYYIENKRHTRELSRVSDLRLLCRRPGPTNSRPAALTSLLSITYNDRIFTINTLQR
jgi:hypothetical protein